MGGVLAMITHLYRVEIVASANWLLDRRKGHSG
jgi:hypothetical protein